MTNDKQFRDHIARLLDWEDAHVGFDKTVAEVPANLQGLVPPKLPYSPWQLLEHIRITQLDILEFCRDAKYEEKKWPEEYWPKNPSPPSSTSWQTSVEAIRRDRNELKHMATDESRNLLDRVPAGNGQTYLREFLLVADHTAYHLGQLVVVRRALGDWRG